MKQKLYIFDLDNTLIAGDSSSLWNHFLVKSNIVTDSQFLQKEQAFMHDYANGAMDIQQYIQHAVAPLVNLSIRQVDYLAWQCIQQEITPIIYPAAKALIQNLQIQQTPVLIISATVSFLVEKIAQQLGISQAIGIDLHTQGRHYRPDIRGIASFQAGKITRLQHWLTQREYRQYTTHFYTDSINDLPLCQYVDQVCLVNPCAQLRQHNLHTRWPVARWKL